MNGGSITGTPHGYAASSFKSAPVVNGMKFGRKLGTLGTVTGSSIKFWNRSSMREDSWIKGVEAAAYEFEMMFW